MTTNTEPIVYLEFGELLTLGARPRPENRDKDCMVRFVENETREIGMYRGSVVTLDYWLYTSEGEPRNWYYANSSIPYFSDIPREHPVFASRWSLPPDDTESSGWYLGYDGSFNPEPVNQIPYFRVWMKHVATFAHEIDTYFSEHTVHHTDTASYKSSYDINHSEDSILRNRNALQYGRALCGLVFDEVLRWSKLDPLGNPAIDAFDWRMEKPKVEALVEALCLACEHPYWLREFVLIHEPDAWRTALDTRVRAFGQNVLALPKLDRSSEPWMPVPYDENDPRGSSLHLVGGNNPVGAWKGFIAQYKQAVLYYDRNYSSR